MLKINGKNNDILYVDVEFKGLSHLVINNNTFGVLRINCQKIQNIEISNNKITEGIFEHDFNSIKPLISLSITHNYLEFLNINISKLNNLKCLDLSSNKIKVFDIELPPNLRELNLYDNFLSRIEINSVSLNRINLANNRLIVIKLNCINLDTLGSRIYRDHLKKVRLNHSSRSYNYYEMDIKNRKTINKCRFYEKK
jgi:Leucine-rich repeat (LRR) protein